MGGMVVLRPGIIHSTGVELQVEALAQHTAQALNAMHQAITLLMGPHLYYSGLVILLWDPEIYNFHKEPR